MLITHYSNQLETLADALVEVVAAPQASPLLAESIIVQSNGMARWLSMHLAQRLGVCAHVDFQFPAAFIWRTIRKLLHSYDIAETSDFETPILTWRVMAVLQNLGDDDGYEQVRAYLQQGDDFRCYELARRIADSFDQYLVYRPHWISGWEQGDEFNWQAILWRRLTAAGAGHRVTWQQRFVQALDGLTVAPAGLPPRLSLLGISALPPTQLDILGRLAEFSDVHLFLLNPCREYWGDIVADRDIARRGEDTDPAEQYLEVGNPLLASLGKQGRDFIDLIQNFPAAVTEHYAEPAENHLLGCLQADILHLRRRGSEDWPHTSVAADDNSVQVHVCHSPTREVEVLHDQLLALFQTQPELRPSDVVVMTPDIEAYSPVIEAVFATVERERAIPFSIADRGIRMVQPLVDVFLTLLELPQSRFDVNQLMALLECPALRRRFGLAETDLGSIQHWLRETGIRWGVDEHSRAALDLPAIREHSWQAGLERLILGYALPGGDERLWAELLPYDDIEGSQAQVLGYLMSFTRAAFRLQQRVAEPLPWSDWIVLLRELLDEFFAAQEDEEEQLQLIRSGLESLAEDTERAGFTAPLSLIVVKTALRNELVTSAGAAGYFSGGVTFCTMVPMRSIPFQVICLIGMNSDSYPRPHRPPDFDLMTQDFRKGDRSRRQDDRYLFLEAIISARRCLYLSYVGNDIRDNSVIPPSVLVSELLDVIEQGFYLADGNLRQHLVLRHPLQAFSRRYFSAEKRLFSYSQELAEVSQRVSKARIEPLPFITAPLPEPEADWRTLELAQLEAFFAHPARYLLRSRLGIVLESGEGLLETAEPFVLDGLSAYRLRETLLPLQLSGKNEAHGLNITRAEGALPHGQVGESLFQSEWQLMQRFSGRVRRALPATEPEPLEVDVMINGLRVLGWLSVYPQSQHQDQGQDKDQGQGQGQGLIGYRPAKITIKDRLLVWLRHLLLNAIAPVGVGRDSHWLGLDGEVHFGPVADPEFYLGQLLDLYWQGLQQPLPFFPRSAYAFVDAYRQNNPKKNPQDIARRVWEGHEFYPGEREDPYYQVAFRASDPLDESFRQLAQLVVQPLFEHGQKDAAT